MLDILNNTNEGFLSKNLNIHDLCNFQIHSASNNLIFLNLKNQYRFDNIRIIQISHSNKVKEKTKYLNLKKELEKAYKLLSVFLSSMRLSEISKIDKNNFNSFIKRVPEEQQHLVLYLYQTSVFIKKSATALRSNDLSRFIELLNYSTTTMIQLGLINDQTLYLLEKLKYLNEILGTSISITNGDITCIFSSGDENKIKNHIEGISENLIYKISEINGISIS
ncbi:MAG: hypothetical protein GTO02_00420 [Candidatus Dadabacteria bacterium]|nr:hypothetical protein [Candidatus Dadabacteria bacterium]